MSKNHNQYTSLPSKHSSNLHTHKSRANYRQTCNISRIIILTIIGITVIVVIIAIVCSVFLNNESLTKYRINALSTDYYENYFYPRLMSSEKFQQSPSQTATFDKYHQYGFDTITLSDLLRHNETNTTYVKYLSSQCDTRDTRITFYPDPPYDAKSYHIEYTYSCNF